MAPFVSSNTAEHFFCSYNSKSQIALPQPKGCGIERRRLALAYGQPTSDSPYCGLHNALYSTAPKNIQLISGKVNEVAYQPGRSDAFYHRYAYDAENKVVKVETSRDKIYWRQEAAYEYYRHGPLARTVLGDKLTPVQGQDYAYTLQGWLKGINGTALGQHDMGKDGYGSSQLPKDVYGFSLNYYNTATLKDFTPIGGVNTNAFAPVPHLSTTSGTSPDNNHKPLYNGNIAAMMVNIPKVNGTNGALLYNYHYDQLNRIVGMDAYKGLDEYTNTWQPQKLDDYKERVSYDPNGNILTYKRHGDAARGLMDDMTYHYKPNTNQLDRVVDDAADVADLDYKKYNDIKRNQTAGNYAYDKIGNLIQDRSEGIDLVEWTVYGKISKIIKTKNGATTTITYTYDASGNRLTKQVEAPLVGLTSTMYVRDASGNVMATYDWKEGDYKLAELHKYGSSRLGMVQVTKQSISTMVPNNLELNAKINTFTAGESFFELSNHLGLVRHPYLNK
jgi:YD repeat-containing protein